MVMDVNKEQLPDGVTLETIGMSKNQQRKLRKYEHSKGKKKEIRKVEREKRREKFKQERQNGGLAKEELRNEQLKRLKNAVGSSIRVAIDLQFDDAMNDKELNHLANQLKRVYGANKASKCPFYLHFLSLKPEGRILRKCCEKNDGFLDYCLSFDNRSIVEAFDQELSRVIYLSPDSSTELEQLEADCVYIIGGLVDDSVQSRVSLLYAEQHGLRTARLPISKYMQRCCATGKKEATFKQILTVNQIFEILLTVHETGDWRAALRRGVPQRTGFVVVDEEEFPVSCESGSS